MPSQNNAATYAAIALTAFIGIKAADLLIPAGENKAPENPVTYSNETVSVPGQSITCVFAHSGDDTKTVHGCINSNGEPDRLENFAQLKTNPWALVSGGCCSEDSSLSTPQARPPLVIEAEESFQSHGGGGGGGGLDRTDFRRAPNAQERATVYPPEHLISRERARVEAEKAYQKCIEEHENKNGAGGGCGGGGADATGPVQEQLNHYGLTPSGFA
ncbi:MAG TPA: hypothetical protein PLV70_01815 [Flavobacteriales bacterium]|nr:hypothetical protein [Flavobacteriales bacterium]